MAIVFKDRDGVRGRITETLEVEYFGRFNEEIEKFVSGLSGFCDDDRGFEGEDVKMHIVLELPHAAPIVEVERQIAN